MLFDFIDKGSKSWNGGVFAGSTGMPTCGPGSKFHICLALFKNTDHGKITPDTTDRIGNDAAAFITDQKKADASFLQLSYDLWSTVTAPLSVQEEAR